MAAATAIPSLSQYGLTAAHPSESKTKSFVFVKLTEQALLAIEQYVQQVSTIASSCESILTLSMTPFPDAVLFRRSAGHRPKARHKSPASSSSRPARRPARPAVA
jgi:hypothetical protein